jgi:muramoyltetrapeptide carboxypeptidase LdcA involved in peptidoglycan recycling
MIPKKLKNGDEIRVIAPARSMSLISEQTRKIAEDRLTAMGYRVSYGKHVGERDEFISSSVESRVADIHEAFSDKNVSAILTVLGGFNSNQILKYLDYGLIKANPKILCGYSDITALANALLAKTGMVTYYGPHFSSFGMEKGFEYTMDHFRRCLTSRKPFEIKASAEWSDDPWYMDQNKRTFIPNEGYWVINNGSAEGKIVGGNGSTIVLLNGTGFMPKLKNSILFIEDDSDAKPGYFDRYLQSIIHQPGFDGVRGIVVGRFQKGSEMTRVAIEKIMRSKRELSGIPIIANADFGHTTPQATFPFGVAASISATASGAEIKINKH